MCVLCCGCGEEGRGGRGVSCAAGGVWRVLREGCGLCCGCSVLRVFCVCVRVILCSCRQTHTQASARTRTQARTRKQAHARARKHTQASARTQAHARRRAGARTRRHARRRAHAGRRRGRRRTIQDTQHTAQDTRHTRHKTHNNTQQHTTTHNTQREKPRSGLPAWEELLAVDVRGLSVWCCDVVCLVSVSALTVSVLAFWLRTLSHECLSRCVKADLWGMGWR